MCTGVFVVLVKPPGNEARAVVTRTVIVMNIIWLDWARLETAISTQSPDRVGIKGHVPQAVRILVCGNWDVLPLDRLHPVGCCVVNREGRAGRWMEVVCRETAVNCFTANGEADKHDGFVFSTIESGESKSSLMGRPL